jgi:hypothetical protein
MARPKFENREKVQYPIRVFFELETIKKLGVKKIREISRKAVNSYQNESNSNRGFRYPIRRSF